MLRTLRAGMAVLGRYGSLADEPITSAIFGFDQMLGCRANRPQFGAQASDDHLNRAIRHRAVLAVKRLREHCPAVNLPRVPDEMSEQATFRSGQPGAGAG